MKRFIFSLLVLIFTAQLSYAQIPVTDGALNFNTTANQITNAVTWGEQLLKLKEQASILTTTLKFVTDVSSAIRDVSYGKSLVQRQFYIVDRCSDIIGRADKFDVSSALHLERNITDFLSTNNSLITLINSTLTRSFKMNDSERLKALMDVKKEQDDLLQKLYITEQIVNTSIASKEIIEFQILK